MHLQTPEFTLDVVLQPKVDLLYSSPDRWVVAGCEALLRLRQGNTLQLPADYLKARAAAGTLQDLILEVLPLVASAVARLRQAHIFLSVAVNVSPPELLLGLPEFYAGLLDRYGLVPCDIPIELTEDGYPSAEQQEVLRRLHTLGAPIHLDDVGSGAAGLQLIHALGDIVSLLKLDRSLTLAVAQNSPRATALVRALAHQHHGRLLAEGPEDLATCETLRALGVRYVQCYYTGRPQPLEALLPRLRRQNGHVALSEVGQ